MGNGRFPAKIGRHQQPNIKEHSMLTRTLYILALSLTFLNPLVRPNAAPSGGDDTVLVAQNGSVTIPMLLNDSDADGDTLSLVSTTLPAQGTLTNHGNNTVTYTPTAGYTGDDSFTYTLSDGNGNQANATVNITVNLAINGAAARSQILNGVAEVYADGYTGNLVAYGPTAYAIVHYPPDGSTFLGPMAAVAGWGAGKVAVLPDHQGLNMNDRGGEGDTGQFFKNNIAWLAGTSSQAISIVTYDADNTTWLTGQGYTNVTTTNATNLAADIATADLFVAGWLGSSEPQANLDAIAAYVKGGGSLFLADYGQGYDYWWGKPFYEAPGNLLLRTAGLAFAADNVWIDGLIDATHVASGQINADQLLLMLQDSSGYTTDELNEGAHLLAGIYDGLPPNDLLAAQLDSYFLAVINSINPTAATPVTDPFEKALLLREADLLVATAPADVEAHRTATAVYGSIPNNAPRVTRSVTLDTNKGRWQATGLYAVPGEVVTLTFPSALVGHDYLVRINAHDDNIAQRDSWERPPYVHRSFPINATTVVVANAFGGSIFIDFGGDDAYAAPPNLGNKTITIANAIEQPYFVLGQHSDQDWLNELRDKPAPYAVFVSDNLILSFRSAEASGLTEPTALMTWWNEVVVGQDYLANRPQPRTSPELINVDMQNSAGAAHSGYPIQAWDEHWDSLVDWADVAVNGRWGDFHELGHNQQQGWWTFDDDGEVTVNIFSNYSLEQLAPNSSNGWAYSASPVATFQQAITDVSGGGTYSSKSDRWSFWFQLADGFGWETYRTVFATYEDDNLNNPNNLPDTNQAEKDEWFKRWSTASGYDMKRFMVDTWGLEVSQSAINAVAALPDWLPILGNVPPQSTISGVAHTIDIEGHALSMDGVANVISTTSPSHGTLVNNQDGTFTYTATSGYTGSDQFSYILQSSAGNTKQFTVSLQVAPSCASPTLVTAVGDDGLCSLRQAVAQATSGQTITFHASLANATIHLQSPIIIDKDLTIDGQQLGLTISGDSDQDGDADVALFEVNQSQSVTLNHLNLVKGRSSTGGVFTAWYSDLTVLNSTFAHNVSTYYGGGAIHAQGLVFIENSTFSNNSSPSAGGALSIRGNGNTIKNSTFIGNSNSTTGGITASGTWHLYNSIIDSAQGADCGGTAPATSINNHVADGSCNAAQSGDPKVGVLQNNGGPTLTHALQANSPAVNQGSSATCLVADQRGIARPQGAGCDMGAVEMVEESSVFLALLLNGGSLQATRPAVGSGCSYLVYESNTPYFGLPTAVSHPLTTSPQTIPNNSGSRFYKLQVSGCLLPTLASSEVGKFQFVIVPGR